jgi:hypothetical protein
MKNQEEFMEELSKKIGQFKFKYEIKDYLNKEGIDPAHHDTLIAMAMKQKSSKNKNLRQIVSILVAGTIFFGFYSLIPNNIYNMAPLIISIVGGVFFGVALIQVVGNFSSFEEFNGRSFKDGPIRQRIAMLMLIPGLITIFVFLNNFNASETNELLEFGKRSRARVIDGSAITIKSSTTYKLELRYRTQESDLIYNTTETVSSSEFSSVAKGDEVDIIYSTKNPKLIELLITDASKAKYLDKKSQNSP